LWQAQAEHHAAEAVKIAERGFSVDCDFDPFADGSRSFCDNCRYLKIKYSACEFSYKFWLYFPLSY